ncbi:hypothetical protein ABTN45_19170, partial [Acinetobacter baumannii]
MALQTAGVSALQNIYDRSKPLDGFDNSVLTQLNKNFPSNDQPLPNSKRALEKFMATRRLDPKSGWFQHVQQASPVELQREALYMQ